MMMAPATIAHNHIVTNLQTMLNNRLERYAPSLLAMQWPGIDAPQGVDGLRESWTGVDRRREHEGRGCWPDDKWVIW